MADEEPETFTQKMCREMTLKLRVTGSRIFVENATPDRLDRNVIELKSWWSPGFLESFATSVRIGDQKHKPFKWGDDGVEVPDEEAEDVVGWDLHDCPIMLTVYRVEDGWLEDNKNRPKDDPIIGFFSYSPPLNSGDGVVNDKRPTIFAWIALGPDNFKLLKDHVAANEEPDFEVGLEVQFPRGTVDNRSVETKVRWDGKDELRVTQAKIVWKRGDWNSHADRERPVHQPPDEQEYEPPREHVELLGTVERLEATLIKLSMPVWIAAVAAVITAAVLLRH